MRVHLFLWTVCGSLCLTTTSPADPILAVGGQSLTLSADSLEVDIGLGEAVLTGNVVLTKGDLKVSCPRIDLRFDNSPHVQWAKGSMGVQAEVRGVHAEAPEVELDLGKQTLELRGGVHLTRGQGFLQADRAVIDIASAKVTLTKVQGSVPVPPGK